MAIVQISKIQQRSGNLVDLPQLDEAEFGFAADEKRLFIGKTSDGIENIEVLTSYSNVDFGQINGSYGNLNITIDANTAAGSNGQVLAFDGNNWVNRGGNAGGLLTLGNVSNVKITGGAIDYVLTTDGTGNLNWTPKSSILSLIENVEPVALDKNSTFATATDSLTNLITVDSTIGYNVNSAVVFSGTSFGSLAASTTYYITEVNSGNSTIAISTTKGGSNVLVTTDSGNMALQVIGTVVTTTVDNFFTDGLTGTITNAVGMTELNGFSYYLDILTSNTFALYNDPLFDSALDCTTYTPYAYTSVTATTASTNYVTVGDTSSFTQFDPVIFVGTTFGNITANQTYYIANIISSTEIKIATSGDGNVSNVVTLTTDSGSANVYATGGRIISTVGGGSGSGNAGGTQYSVQYNNSNLLDGDANFTYDFANRLLTITSGNANLGNINATDVINASKFVSNIATGTQPITVTSTTRVANLNVSYSNVTDYSAVTQQTTGSFFPVFVNGNASANYQLGTNNFFSFNVLNGNFSTQNLTVNVNSNVGNIGATGNITAANIYANSGTIGASLLTGTLTTQAQPNITSLGNATTVTVAGSLNPSANITYNLGNATNRWNALYLSGSTIYLGNAVITSNASGVVITNASGGTFTVSGNGAANSAAIVNGNSNVIVSANSNVNISVAGTANVLTVTSTGANITGTVNVTGNANAGNIGVATGVFTTAANTGLVQSGTSNITLTSGGNVSTFIGGNATAQFVVTGSGANIAGTANIVGNANVGNLGTATAVITTGNITTINSGLVQNGNSNVTITGNSNVSIFVAGNATARAVFTSTGANIAGTANITGNANVNNLGTTQIVASGNVSATQFISNIATGAAPLIVTSTTKVANLNADTLDGYDTASTSTANTVVIRDTNGSFSANVITATLSGAATTAGTVTTNAQPNITSVSTSFTNLTFANAQTITGNNLTLTTGANTNPGTITGNWTLSTGSRMQATYADLAEYYTSDVHYEPGTVLEFGGTEEVTIAQDGTNKVAGVVSTNPAYVMNSSCEGKHIVAIALQGRVPCKVRGVINKGDMLISGGNGFARATLHPYIGTVIGKALQNFDGVEGVIEVAVGRL